MLYKSEAQRKYFHANKKILKKQIEDVKLWDNECKGLTLPKKSKRNNLIL